MKLDRIELRKLVLPLKFSFETSFGLMTRKEFLLVAASADGVTGYGECVADENPYYLPETNETVRHILRDFLAPLVFSLDIEHPRALLSAFARVRGHNMAKASLEMAVWDLEATRRRIPLCGLFGGGASEIASGVSIGLQKDEATLLRKVEAEVAAGYRRIKVKIKPGRDIALVEAIRRRFPGIPLMVDANSAYSLVDAPLLKRFDAMGLMMIEQPLAWDDVVDHAVLQRSLETPICLDESINSAADARHAIELGACRIVNIKAGRVGGIAGSIAVHDVCRERGIPVWCGGMLESGIGRLANVHLQTLPGFTLPGDTSASARYFDEDLVDPPVTVSANGTICVPVAPGLGHAIIWSRVERATVAREEWRSPA